jgi:hypothetical protein
MLCALVCLGCGGRDVAVLGGECTSDLDCPLGLECFLGPDGARAWEGGYCTRPCDADDCPEGATCAPAYFDAAGFAVTYCLAGCDREIGSAGGCRPGYTCSFEGACRLGCSTDEQCAQYDVDPGGPYASPGATCEIESGRCLRGAESGAGPGEACTADDDCRGPISFCAFGACASLSCDLGGEYACGSESTCAGDSVPYDQVIPMCWRTCTLGVDGTASAGDRCGGAACYPLEADPAGTATSAYCSPPFGQTLAGSDTAHVGDPCTRTEDCPNPFGMGFCDDDGVCQIAHCAPYAAIGIELCGAGERCFTSVPEPGTTRPNRVIAETGLCVRDCTADPSVCQPPTRCGPLGHCAVDHAT